MLIAMMAIERKTDLLRSEMQNDWKMFEVKFQNLVVFVFDWFKCNESKWIFRLLQNVYYAYETNEKSQKKIILFSNKRYEQYYK